MPVVAPPPPAFVQAVEKQLAGTQMHVVDWWADDLDGDHIPESIALVCDDSVGEYIVQRGIQLLELPGPFDGRNPCPDVATPPAWHVEHAGTISFAQSVHHGSIGETYAIRGGVLVELRLHSDGFDVGSDGDTGEVDDDDYETLRWSQRITPPHRKATVRSGPIAIVTDDVQRATKLVGASTLAVTRDDGHGEFLLHIHADRELAIRSDRTVHLGPGDSELPVEQVGELDIAAAGTIIHVHLQPIPENGGYPPAQP
jgi:hypothetical protein